VPQYQPQPQPQPQYQQPQPQYQAPAAGSGRRSDVFDPNQNPNAPGAPRALGTTPPSQPLTPSESAGVGATGDRDAGSPLDLTTLSANAAGNQGAADGGLPPPPPRNPSATGARTAALPPSQTPRDAFDAAYGAILRKDYTGAEEGFRAFLQRYPSDRMAPDAQYWLGESMFQRQNWREAADAFLSMSKKYESNPKAAEALLRLGQSLAALREKELACATFGEIGRKYPRASTTIKQAIEREQKRVRC
jgi:tol-pal system protein YbgF